MGAAIPDITSLIQAGINPKNGLPLRMGGSPSQLKNDIKKFLRNIDEQDAVNRYVWKNLPANITSQELERMLYYKGQLAFFYIEDLDEYFFMPYALDGTIDFYGRFNSIHPVPMANGTTENENWSKAQANYLSRVILTCLYDEKQIEKHISEKNKCCVLIHDYTKQLSQTIISRQIVNDPLLDVMAECVPFLRTSLISGSGIKGIRVNDADQQESVKDGSRSMLNAALTGDPWVPVVGNIEFQELTDGSVLKSEEYMLAMQSLDNLRLSGYGLENGGLFEKKSHLNDSENEINQSGVSLVMQDGLEIRKHFCDMINQLFELDVSVEMNQTQEEMTLGDEATVEEGGNNDEFANY
mgnify:CR=1 FL=1